MLVIALYCSRFSHYSTLPTFRSLLYALTFQSLLRTADILVVTVYGSHLSLFHLCFAAVCHSALAVGVCASAFADINCASALAESGCALALTDIVCALALADIDRALALAVVVITLHR